MNNKLKVRNTKIWNLIKRWETNNDVGQRKDTNVFMGELTGQENRVIKIRDFDLSEFAANISTMQCVPQTDET